MLGQPISYTLSILEAIAMGIWNIVVNVFGFFADMVWGVFDHYLPPFVENPAFTVCVLIAFAAVWLSFRRPVLAGLILSVALSEAHYQYAGFSMLSFMFTQFNFEVHQNELLGFIWVMLTVAGWYAAIRWLLHKPVIVPWLEYRARKKAEKNGKSA